MAKAKNPFTYGGRVAGETFCNRRKEIKELLSDILARQHVILFSQRRFGKTSLVWRVLSEARKNGVIPIYVDIYPVSSLAEFIELYAKAIAEGLSGYEKAMKLLKGLFSRLYLSMGLDAMGNPQWNVGFDRTRETESLDEVLMTFEAYLLYLCGQPKAPPAGYLLQPQPAFLPERQNLSFRENQFRRLRFFHQGKVRQRQDGYLQQSRQRSPCRNRNSSLLYPVPLPYSLRHC